MAEHVSVIPAGGSGKLTAKVTTKPTQNGKVTKTITVETDSPGAERVVLRLGFEVSSPILIKPSPRVVLTAIQGAQKSERVLLHRSDGKPLEVVRVEVPSPQLIQAKTTPAKAGEQHGAVDGDVWLEVTVKPDAASVSTTEILKLVTNHPEAGTLELPVNLRVRGLVEATPEKVQLYFAEDSPAGRSTIVRIRHNQGKAFEIRELTVSDPALFTATSLSPEAANVLNIRLDLAPGVDAKTLTTPRNGSLRITCSEEAQPVIEVPVIVSPRSMTGKRQTARPPRPLPAPQRMLRPTPGAT